MLVSFCMLVTSGDGDGEIEGGEVEGSEGDFCESMLISCRRRSQVGEGRGSSKVFLLWAKRGIRAGHASVK